jgi:hypothetical protein
MHRSGRAGKSPFVRLRRNYGGQESQQVENIPRLLGFAGVSVNKRKTQNVDDQQKPHVYWGLAPP